MLEIQSSDSGIQHVCIAQEKKTGSLLLNAQPDLNETYLLMTIDMCVNVHCHCAIYIAHLVNGISST